MTATATHLCPAPEGCTREVPQHFLMCARHWSQVPKAIQHRVYSTYWKVRKTGRETQAHLDAMRDAINSLPRSRQASVL